MITAVQLQREGLMPAVERIELPTDGIDRELNDVCAMLRGQEHSRTIKSRPTNSVGEWIDYRLPIVTFFRRELHEYPTPRNLSYLWNFGSLSGIVLVIMIVTGIVLAMHYTPTADGAFNSVEHIMRDVNLLWIVQGPS